MKTLTKKEKLSKSKEILAEYKANQKAGEDVPSISWILNNYFR